MFINKETKYWQEEYRRGNLDNMEILGETRALLDGSAERIGLNTLYVFLWALIPIIIMGVFGFIQERSPIMYEQLQDILISCGASLGTNYDPTVFFIVEIIIAIILFNILQKIYKKVKQRKNAK